MFDRYLMGLLMDEAGGGDAGGGGVADLGAASLDSTSTALVPVGDQSVAATETDDATEETPQGGEIQQFKPVENGKWSKPATQALSTIKTSHPKLYQQLARDRGIVERLYSTVPPGVNPFDAIKSSQRIMKELGGERGIAEIRQSLAEMEQLDLWYASGDSRFLDNILGVNGDPKDAPFSQGAFVKMVPQAVARLEKVAGGPKAIVDLAPMIDGLHYKLAPKSYQRGVATQILNDLTRNDVDLHFRRLAQLVPADNEIAKESVAAISKYFADRQALSKVEPEALPDPVNTQTKDPAREELDRDRQQFNDERRKAEIQGWSDASNRDIRAIFDDAMGQHGTKLSEGAKETIKLAVGARMQQAFKNTASYDESRKSYFDNNDKAGYLRYMRGLAESHIPRIVKAEIGKLYPTKNGNPPEPKPGAPAAQRTTPEAGFRRVASAPAANEIDMRHTTMPMFKDGKAVLKTGQKVQWK